MIVNIFSKLDWFIHWMMIEIFDLIFRIAEVNIFTDSAISTFTNRIYGILGVVILFKIVISAIQYLVSPDKLLDKDKGIGGLLQRTIISVALLALVPTIFDFAKEIQVYVSGAIPQIILGQQITFNDGEGSDTHKIAKDLSVLTLRVFIIDKATNQPAELGNELTDYLDKVTVGCDPFGMGDGCKYDYNWFFSILAGGFMVYIFLSMGIDIAVRSIKMGIIQILAPIPISSYINSEENFKAWYKTAFKVYADLFVRLIVIYFIVYIINTLAIGGVSIGNDESNAISIIKEPFLYLYIIIALLLFAKSAPKFICEILGIKSDGFGDMGEMFKPAWSRAGGTFAAATGMLTTGVGNMINRGMNSNWKKGWRQNLKNVAGMLGSGAAGAASAGLHGGMAAIQGKSWREVNAAGAKRAVTARQNRDQDRTEGITFGRRVVTSLMDHMGLDTPAGLAEGQQKVYGNIHQGVGNFKKAVLGRLEKNSMVQINRDSSAIEKLGLMLNQSSSAILASGNDTLINALYSFETGSDGKIKLVDGANITFSNLKAIAKAAEMTKGCEELGTQANGDIMRDAEKSLFSDVMKGEVYDVNGNVVDEFNAKDGKAHLDIQNALGNIYADISKGVTTLSNVVFKVPKKDEHGNVIYDSEGKVVKEDVKYNTYEELMAAFNQNYAVFDDTLQRENARLSAEINTSRDAATRASTQRRNSNNNSGK